MQQAVEDIMKSSPKKRSDISGNMTNATDTSNTPQKKGPVAKLLSIVLWGIVLILVAVLIASIVSQGESSILGFRSYYVRTDSMTPTFSAGSWILVKEVPIEQVEPGDILTFRLKDSKDTIVTHRCINVDTDENGNIQAWTQGDANSGADPNPVIKERLLGETIFWIGGLGRVVAMLQSPAGYIFLGILIFLMIFIPEFINYVKKSKN